MTKSVIIPKETLKILYEKEGLTTFQIADKFGCCQATIWKRFKELKIKMRLPGVERVTISKEELRELYVKKKLSTWRIEKETRIPRGTVHRKLKEFGLPTRDLATANTIYPKKNFSGDLLEKAYLIGFAIGDLRVRKQYKNSRTVCVACGTTIQEQTDLLKKLFKVYGRVWTKKTNSGKTNIEIFLNESFDFLLTKNMPGWVLKNKKRFFSFLAGFVDAEGSIGIYNNMAKFSLGNYDSSLLLVIWHNLNRFGVNCNKPVSDRRRGKKNSEGYRYNQNYWHFGIQKKDELLRFLAEISPYLKHKNKLKALKMAVKNINDRSRKWQKKNTSN